MTARDGQSESERITYVIRGGESAVRSPYFPSGILKAFEGLLYLHR